MLRLNTTITQQEISFAEFSFLPNLPTKELWQTAWKRDWFCGLPVRINSRLTSLSDTQLLNCFINLLNKQMKYLISNLWNNSGRLRALATANDGEFISCNFKIFLKSQSTPIIREAWKASKQTQDLYLGNDTSMMLLTRKIENFKFVLHSECAYVISEIWNESQIFRLWLTGSEITLDKKPPQCISLEALLVNFASILASRDKKITANVWKDNKKLHAAYSGLSIEIDNSQPFCLLNKVIENFRHALAARNSVVIKEMLALNPNLLKWLHGKEVNFGTLENSVFKTITPGETITFFKAILASRMEMVERVYVNNQFLQDTIAELADNCLTTLIHKVLSSDVSGNTNFAIKFLKSINKLNILENILIEYDKKLESSALLSPSLKKKMTLLDARIAELNPNHKKRHAPEILQQDNTLGKKIKLLLQVNQTLSTATVYNMLELKQEQASEEITPANVDVDNEDDYYNSKSFSGFHNIGLLPPLQNQDEVAIESLEEFYELKTCNL